MSLNILPDEILVDIFQILGEESDYYDDLVQDGSLYQVALSSRRLNRLATPMLYRTFIQTKHSTLKKFLRRVLEVPKLRGCVRRFGIEQLEPGDATPFECNDPNIYEAAIRAVEHDTAQSEDWIIAVRAGEWDAVIALLFVILPNLEEIHVLAWNIPFWIKKILANCAPGQRQEKARGYLENVTTMYVAYWHDKPDGFTLEEINHFLKLGTVKSANFDMVLHETFLQNQPLSFSLENLRSLFFDDSHIDSHLLKDLLRSCPNLQSFRFYHCGYSNGPNGPNVFVPQRVSAGLCRARKSLRELRLRDSTYKGQIQRPFGSLVDFEVLTDLEMDACILFGYMADAESSFTDSDSEDDEKERLRDYVKLIEVLPSSLQSLQINQCWDVRETQEQLADLLEKREGVVPVLKTIDIIVNTDYTLNISVLKDLEGPFESAGIELCVTKCSYIQHLGEMRCRN